ncbi:S4 domain-containing protein YaaA [Alkalibacterium sp. f15]|uniref:S4 domain-containing protein YaaA n=1 Tax=Alkalibacterium sp. f15 TaxID=3414029 RepID=UPI003BF7C92F
MSLLFKEPITVSEIIQIDDSMITLGQFLKHANIISSGGMAKPFLLDTAIWVNGEPENRRGKKLRHGDTIKIKDFGTYTIESSHDGE